MLKVTSTSTELEWEPQGRTALVRYTPGVTLTGADGDFLVSSLTGWIGEEGKRFSILADAKDLRGTDAVYRARASTFFRNHRETASIALINVGAVIGILVEMFRIGTGVPLKAFSNEAQARAWLVERSEAPG
jgi:hypothetical protein